MTAGDLNAIAVYLKDLPASRGNGGGATGVEAQLRAGRSLYDINCASCHGIFTAGKDGVPNFTQKQFDKYSTQYVLRDQVNHAVAFKMNPEDLAFVMDYLRYRKSANPAENVIPPDPR